MPDDSIMDIVDNDEGFYEDLQKLYLRWYKRGDRWTRTWAMNEALGRARLYADAINKGHSQKAVRAAAREMVDGFANFKKYHEQKLQKVANAEAEEARLYRFWETSLPPEAAAHAKHYEDVVRKASIFILRELVPAPPAVVKAALERGDYNLESIPAESWMAAAEQIPYLPGKGLDTQQKIEALKHIARWHYGV